MKRKIVVAAIQFEIKPLDIDVNLSKIEMLIADLCKERCDLIVLPEDCITGPDYYPTPEPQDESSKSIKLLKQLAIKYQIYLVCGSFTKKVGKKLFSTSLLINPKGGIILEYQKNNLWHPERPYLAKGNNIQVVKTPIGTIGIIICWDLAFPEICRKLIKMGADIICCPSYWTVDDSRMLHKKYGKLTEHIFVNTLCPARAIENEVLFIYANGAGTAKMNLKTIVWKAPQIGQSQICVPILGTVIKMESNNEGYITYEYDRQLANDAEKTYKIRQDINSIPASNPNF